jgi:hypothetical protein
LAAVGTTAGSGRPKQSLLGAHSVARCLGLSELALARTRARARAAVDGSVVEGDGVARLLVDSDAN